MGKHWGWFFAVLLLSACAPAPPRQDAVEHGPLQVLFIGSSHLAWHDAPGVIEELITATGRPVHVGKVLKPGILLDQLAQDPDVLNAIAARPWDHVVFQGASMPIAYPESHFLIMPRLGKHPVEPAMATLAKASRKRGAEPIYMQPWAFEDGLTWIAGHAEDTTTMQDAIIHNTKLMAARLDLTVAPVGEAWRLAMAEHPELPLFADDHNHPSVLGSYLMACVISRVILGDMPVSLAVYGGVPENTARYLQGVSPRVPVTPP